MSIRGVMESEKKRNPREIRASSLLPDDLKTISEILN